MPVYSWDNNKIFKTASLQRMGLEERHKLPLSEYSPDMHKAIEHPFHILKHKVQEQLLQPRLHPITTHEAQQLVIDCFMSISKDSIAKDVASLPVTYHVIAGDKGVVSLGPDGEYHTCSGGDWPARRYR
jgi:hypothetical protein